MKDYFVGWELSWIYFVHSQWTEERETQILVLGKREISNKGQTEIAGNWKWFYGHGGSTWWELSGQDSSLECDGGPQRPSISQIPDWESPLCAYLEARLVGSLHWHSDLIGGKSHWLAWQSQEAAISSKCLRIMWPLLSHYEGRVQARQKTLHEPLGFLLNFPVWLSS